MHGVSGRGRLTAAKATGDLGHGRELVESRWGTAVEDAGARVSTRPTRRALGSVNRSTGRGTRTFRALLATLGAHPHKWAG
jgi:hypothetical protein